MTCSKPLVLTAAAVISWCTFAENWYVSESGDDSNDGKSWETAFRRLSKPLGRTISGRGVAASGDTVWVEDGYECSTEKGDAYMGAIPNTGSGAATVIVQPGVTFRSRSGDWRTGAIIRGVGAYPCLSLTEGATAFGFQLIGGGTTGVNCGGVFGVNRSTCVVSNCLVKGCSSKAANTGIGNVYNVQVHKCVITENIGSCVSKCDIFDSTLANGTCPILRGGETVFDHCTITNFDNSRLIQSASRFTACDILHNSGLLVTGAGSVFVDCTIANNTRVTDESKLAGFIAGTATVLSNCTVKANTIDHTKGGKDGFTSGCLFSTVRAVGCTITENVLGGAYMGSGNNYGIIGEGTEFEDCLVYGNTITVSSVFVRSGSVRNSVFAHTTDDTLAVMCLNTKFCNSTLYGNCRSCPGVSTNSVWWNTATKAPGDKAGTYANWSDKTIPVNSCSLRAADDTTGTSFSDDPQLDLDVTSKTFLMPLKDSPCIDKCTGDFDFDWMHVAGAKDACGRKRVNGLAVDIGGVEYNPPAGLLLMFR